mgnify:CR=1 FL=1
METRGLGASEIRITPIIMGTAQASRVGWVGIEDSDMVKAIRTAYDRGITTIDTAALYGNGHSEKIVAKALSNVRDRVVYATKVFVCDLNYDRVIFSCEESLKRLKTDYIDLYQIHWPSGTFNSAIVPISETMAALNQLKNQGKIRAIGVSNFSVSQLHEARKYGRIDSVQPPYSLFWRQIEADLIPYCLENNISILAYSPLAQGLLTGRFDNRRRFHQDSFRAKNKLFADRDNYDRVQKAVDRLRPIADRKGCSLAQLSLAWVIFHFGVSAIVGARNSEQMAENAQAIEVELTAKDVEEIEAIGRIVTDGVDEIDRTLWIYDPTEFVPVVDSNSKNLVANLERQTLRSLRMEVARKWLSLPVSQIESACQSNLGRVHFQLLHESIFFLDPVGEEVPFVRELATKIEHCLEDDRSIQYRLAAMLYAPGYQWKNYHCVPIPVYLLNCFFLFTIDSRKIFRNLQELETFNSHLRSRTREIDLAIQQFPIQDVTKEIAHLWTTHINFSTFKLSVDSVRLACQQRHKIIKFALHNLGHSLQFKCDVVTQTIDKIRLGVLLDIPLSPAKMSAIASAIEYLDRDRFQVIVYRFQVEKNSVFYDYCQNFVDRLVDLPCCEQSAYADLSDRVKLIRDDRLDILLFGGDLTARTTVPVTLAHHRLAPLQVATASSPISPEIDTIDAYIRGSLVATHTSKNEIQKLETIPGSGYCFNDRFFAYNTISIDRDRLNIEPSATIFICATNWHYITPAIKQTWAKILASVSDSILILQPLDWQGWQQFLPFQMFVESMETTFEEYGLDRSRLLLPNSPRSLYEAIAYLKIADIYLDTYPYSDPYPVAKALSFGLPVVTLEGETLPSRSGGALLRELEISDFIANSEHNYVRLSQLLGCDRDRRLQYCQQIQQQLPNAAFLDRRTYSARMGELLEKLYCRWQERYSSESISSFDDTTKIVIF